MPTPGEADIQALSDPCVQRRYEALTRIEGAQGHGHVMPSRERSAEVNNHIHTWYSFSPYSPAMAVYRAWDAGLAVCGVVDHESVGGAEEMLRAAQALGLGATVGCEMRVSFLHTPFKDKKLNNPDMAGIAYMVIHGIAHCVLADMDAFLQPMREARYARTQAQTRRLSALLEKARLPALSFEEDVLPLSEYGAGGTITERHMLYACAHGLIAHCGKGARLLQTLEEALGLKPTQRVAQYLCDEENPHYVYDVLGVLKSSLLPRVYIRPCTEECPPVEKAIECARSIGAIPAYPYLGDVGESVTGDKKAETFEDEFLDDLFEYAERLGFLACTYMPPRNSMAQLQRVSALSKKHGFMEISGVDINSSRQEFLYRNPSGYEHLVSSAWALVEHETMVCQDRAQGLFSEQGTWAHLPLQERVVQYAQNAKGKYAS